MSDGVGAIAGITELLSARFPSHVEINQDRVKAGVWFSALERLESRLIFMDALYGGGLMDQGRHAYRPADTELTLQHVFKASSLLDGLIVQQSSKQAGSPPRFPFREWLAELLTFKWMIAQDPSVKMIFAYAVKGIKSRESQPFPRVASLPRTGHIAQSWYKYYGQYQSNLPVVMFDEQVASRLSLDPTWLETDETLIIMLMTYAIKRRDKSQCERVLRRAESLKKVSASIASLTSALRAFISRL
jgi:hypothetical protein